MTQVSQLNPTGFKFELNAGVGLITLNRPQRYNALTFDIYQELSDFFVTLQSHSEVRAIVISGEGKAFCSGGDVEDIIGELFSRDMQGLLDFTRVTGALIQNIRQVRKPVIAAVNGVAVGAGAVIALACDLRYANDRARFGFIFPQVGLCGADMGATYLLPKVVGLGHASELLFSGDMIKADRALEIGLVNKICGEQCLAEALSFAKKLAQGPAFAHSMTKQMLEAEAQMTLAQAIEAEAQAQAICMQHPDFREAHDAWCEKRDPKFEGSPQ
ncbi:MAG: enoyl-CoA hydratase [Myxococcales bacterium]|nr:enoyl-CoA hydratase [Myxococcales bacterium]